MSAMSALIPTGVWLTYGFLWIPLSSLQSPTHLELDPVRLFLLSNT